MAAILCSFSGKLCNPVNAVTIEVRLLTWLLTELSAALSGQCPLKRSNSDGKKGRELTIS